MVGMSDGNVPQIVSFLLVCVRERERYRVGGRKEVVL